MWTHRLRTVVKHRLGGRPSRTSPPDLTQEQPPDSAADATSESKAVATAEPSPPAKGSRIPAHYDEPARATIRRVLPRTMTRHEKLFGLIQSVRYVVAHDVPGAVVECGVWRGGSMQAAALTLLEVGARDRDLHLFDTFDGMTAPTEHDVRNDGVSAERLLSTEGREEWIWAVATLEDVRAGMSETAYPEHRVHYHQGTVEETIPTQAPDVIAILRLDTDWYASTRHELAHLYDRLSPGGVLIIDDYGHWAGARLAVDEFLEASKAALLLLPSGTGRIAVKPTS